MKQMQPSVVTPGQVDLQKEIFNLSEIFFFLPA